MRAKMRLHTIENHEGGGETLRFTAVGKSEAYEGEGEDENNTYSRYTPSADLSMYVANPDLQGKFEEGQEFYLDFSPAE
jgi:hypothetical protein